MGLLFALAGNQNCGKTTLFNQLTGSNQHVGNFPGVTVEKKEGRVRKHKDSTVVDLPGIYALSPYTPEEIVTRDFLLKEHPDGIINIVDATNIERNLYLTMQLMQLELPMVIALNMMDEVRKSGNTIDIAKLEEELGVAVVPISASKNEGVDELIERAIKAAEERKVSNKLDFCAGEVHRAIHSIAHIIENNAKSAGFPVRYAATKLVEGDEPTAKALSLTENEVDIIGHIVTEMEQLLGTDREAALADMRYEYIDRICGLAVVKNHETAEQERSVKIDKILTNKYLAMPVFLGIMLTIFWLTFGPVGSAISDLFRGGIDLIIGLIDKGLTVAGVSHWMHSLVVDGICSGVGSVLSFLPVIVLLFFFLSILEDTGYMARVAFVMDKLLRKIGLSGRSFVPMLIGFGCSVPAIMATRTLSSERDRKMTIIITPFMSCSARLPIYAVFTAALFQKNQALVMLAMYVLGMVVAILTALLMKSSIFKGKPVPFIMELPAYRMPSPKSVVLHMWEKAKDFLQRAFTIIFFATIAIWFFSNLSFTFNMVSSPDASMLASFGRLIAPIFAPLGFGDWRASTALITGFLAKESVVSTFSVLLGAASNTELLPSLRSMFSPLSAFAFLSFTLLYMPCVAAFAAIRRELGGMKAAIATVAYQTGTAWVVAFIIYQGGKLLGL